MTKEQSDAVQAAADHVMGLEEELEAAGYATVDGADLEHARAVLHQWVDRMIGVVITPALGRVTVIHEHGRRSTIASADLPFLMSTPVAAKRAG